MTSLTLQDPPLHHATEQKEEVAVTMEGLEEETPFSERFLTLKTVQGDILSLPLSMVLLSELIKTSVDQDPHVQEITLSSQISRVSLVLVGEYLRFHAGVPANEIKSPLRTNDLSKEGVCDWDVGFIQRVVELGMQELYDLTHASNWLDIKGLLQLCTVKIASLLKGRTHAACAQILDPKDSTPKVPLSETVDPPRRL